MTNEEALTIVNDVIEKAKITPTVEDYSLWETIREALEKQTAKKPLTVELGDDIYKHCPACGADVSKYMRYCSSCGQKLKWEAKE